MFYKCSKIDSKFYAKNAYSLIGIIVFTLS